MNAEIARDESMDRTYIPLPGGWEVQTKGKGSTFRIVEPNGHRLAIPPSPYLHELLERMARDLHAAFARLSQPAGDEARGVAGRIVGWARTDYITDRDGVPIGLDEPRVVWISEHPDPEEGGWHPLYDGPAPTAGDARDAQRYRWLRDNGAAGTGHPFIAIYNGNGFSQWTGERADEMVDAAMLLLTSEAALAGKGAAG